VLKNDGVASTKLSTERDALFNAAVTEKAHTEHVFDEHGFANEVLPTHLTCPLRVRFIVESFPKVRGKAETPDTLATHAAVAATC
jgi:hypothetical protein